MPTVEMDETEVMNLRKIASNVQKLLSNPQTRTKMLEAQKLINPDVVIPEIDSTKPVFDELKAMREEMKTLKEQTATDKAEAVKQIRMSELSAQWSSGQNLARKAGYTEDGLKALEDFMEKNGVADHKIAMPAFERMNPQMAPVDETGSQAFNVFEGIKNDGEDIKALLDGDEQQFLRSRIKETLAGVRSGNLN